MALLVMSVEWPGPQGSPIPSIAAKLEVRPDAIDDCILVRKSLDARQRRKRWLANYKVTLGADEASVLERGIRGVRAWTARDEEKLRGPAASPVVKRAWPADVRPVVVGAGPAGLFAALRLAEMGAPVLLLERGQPVDRRVRQVNAEWRRRADLDPDNNVVFGEGGAGTFSDGKIYTRRRDGALGYVFRRLVDFGADPRILHEAWAHLGTDRVRAILPVLRARLLELGVEVRFGARVASLLVQDQVCTGVVLASGETIRRGPVVVAAGHSARDTYRALVDAGAHAVSRPISIGARVEHPQELIDRVRYGGPRGELPPASYRLTHTPKRGRAAHTFCMCPGGIVVPATAQRERVVVNGMSFAARRAFWANSAVIVHIDPSEYSSRDPLAGLAYQDAIEHAAYKLAGADYTAPAQRVQDLLEGRAATELPRTSFPLGVAPVDLHDVLPEGIVGGLKAALRAFDRQLPGFAGPDAVLIAPETRTTSPLRFSRDDAMQSTTLPGLLPIGEGAGYAGGIASAALEGVRAGDAIAARYALSAS
jgi:uncharacterized FAD-dependent dehydrogenase